MFVVKLLIIFSATLSAFPTCNGVNTLIICDVAHIIPIPFELYYTIRGSAPPIDSAWLHHKRRFAIRTFILSCLLIHLGFYQKYCKSKLILFPFVLNLLQILSLYDNI